MRLSEYLSDFFADGNIYKNDKLILHSNISNLYRNLLKEKFRFKVEDIADFIINYIGVKGTLIVPTFNFDFAKEKYFQKKIQFLKWAHYQKFLDKKPKKIDHGIQFTRLLFSGIYQKII